MSQQPPADNPYESPQTSSVDAPATSPTDYKMVPLLRRHGFCSPLIFAHVIVMLLGSYVPIVRLLGIFTTIGVIVVCVVVITGPVYYKQLSPDGVLKKWGTANKVAAVILMILFVGGYALMMYWLTMRG